MGVFGQGRHRGRLRTKGFGEGAVRLGSDERFFGVGIDFSETANREIRLRSKKGGIEGGDQFRGDGVVRIYESNKLTADDFEAGVAGGGEALVSLAENANPRVLAGKLVGQFPAGVRGAVVDNNNIKVRISLGEDGVDTAGESGGGIVGGDDDGDERESFRRNGRLSGSRSLRALRVGELGFLALARANGLRIGLSGRT